MTRDELKILLKEESQAIARFYDSVCDVKTELSQAGVRWVDWPIELLAYPYLIDGLDGLLENVNNLVLGVGKKNPRSDEDIQTLINFLLSEFERVREIAYEIFHTLPHNVDNTAIHQHCVELDKLTRKITNAVRWEWCEE